MCAIYCVITGAVTIQLKQVLIENHTKRQEERKAESDHRSNENLRLAFFTVLCTLGFVIVMVLLGVGGVLVRRKCVKAAEKEKRQDLLLRKLVAKTDNIERGLNDDGDNAGE